MNKPIRSSPDLAFSPLLLNLIFTAGCFSGLLYLSGYSYYRLYCMTLGIAEFGFFDISYSQCAIKGFIASMMMMAILLPNLQSLIVFLFESRAVNQDLASMDMRLRTDMRLSAKERKSMKSEFSGMNKKFSIYQKEFLVDYLHLRMKFGFILGLATLLLSTALFFLGAFEPAYFLLVYCVTFVLAVLFLWLLVHVLKSANRSIMLGRLMGFGMAIFFLIFIFPSAFLGFAHAKYRLAVNDFDAYDLVLDGRQIQDARLLMASTEQYFFFVEDKTLIIPRSEVKIMSIRSLPR